MKCGSLKEGWGEANSRHEDLSRGSDCHKDAPTSTLLKQSQRVLLLAIKYILWTQSRSHWFCFPLRSLPTKEGILHVPRTRFQGVASHQMLQGADAPKYLLIHSKTSHKAQHLALTLSKELILALTLKLVLSLRIWSICTWMAWRCSWMCMRFLGTPASFKWPGWDVYIALQAWSRCSNG